MNSVSLFSFSNHSLLSSLSSPVCSDEQQFMSSDSNRNEPDASSVIKPLESENKFAQNDLQAISLHSTPYHSNHPFSKRLHTRIVYAGRSFTAVVRLSRTYNPRHKSLNTWVIFPSPMLIWCCSHFSAPKCARLNIGEGEGHI